MALYNIDAAQLSDLTNKIEDNNIYAVNMDASSGQKEYVWQNSRAALQWGIFCTVPQLKSAFIMKAIWNVGKGYTTDVNTEVTLDHISGFGKDCFDDILFNMEVQKRIYGDAYAEIIRDKDTQRIINLKPLDNATMRVIIDENNLILRYETKAQGKETIKWKPNEIFHLIGSLL